MHKILLAEDDQNLGYLIREELNKSGYAITWCENGADCLSLWSKQSFDLCILDIMMPEKDGFEVATQIRGKDQQIPIIFLTARSMEEDRLTAFEIGADDYIIKPFSMQELIYRIEARLKFKTPSGKPSLGASFGQCKLDTKNYLLKVRSETKKLTEIESQVLSMLSQNINQLVKREDILLEVWGENDYFKGRSLDVFIARIRKLIAEDQTLEIKNTHGHGFTLIEK